MPNPLKHYAQTNANWRRSLRVNNQRTFFIITTFFLIYGAIGLLVDLYWVSGHYPSATLGQITAALLTFQITPSATLILLGIAGVSLLITFLMHNKLMLLGTEYHEVTPQTARTPQEQQLYNVVEEMKVASGLRYLPKIFIIEANYMNAFASGYSEKSAMVAITRGLLTKLNREELQAVMAHELSHIRHLDIKLTLMASVLTNLMVIIIDILFYNALFSGRRSDDRERSSGLLLIIMLIRFLLPVITMLLMFYLSRTREYMADAGAVELQRDNRPLAQALMKISQDHVNNQNDYQKEYRAQKHESVRHEAYIFDPTQAGIKPVQALSDLFSTHPTLEKRLKAIGFLRR